MRTDKRKAKPKPKARRGRPTRYTPEVAAGICTRLAVLLDGQGGPILRLQAGLEDQGEAVRHLLMSALPVVEAAAKGDEALRSALEE